MTKQQENRAFVKMLKEFPKAFGRVSFRERLMLRTAFTYVLEARYEDRSSIIRQLGERCDQLLKDKGELIDKIVDIKANFDFAIEGRDVEIKELEQENAGLKEQIKQIEKVSDYNADQLTKAKDQIKQLLDCLKQDTNDPETNYYVCQYMDKAEQFLKEIEK